MCQFLCHHLPVTKLDPAALENTWADYFWQGDVESRNRLILHYTSLVRYVAIKARSRLVSQVEVDDLVSYGIFGLIDAISKFDPEKGVKFETYAVQRIHGAIYDEIRSLDWVPRSVRSKARDIDRAKAELEAELGRPADHTEVAQYLGLTSDEYSTLTSQAVVAQVESRDHAVGVYHETSFDPTADPGDQIEIKEVMNLVGEAVSGMDQKSKTILVLYYLQEMTLAEIGQILGVTESRVCQLQSRALQALRAYLGDGKTLMAA